LIQSPFRTIRFSIYIDEIKKESYKFGLCSIVVGIKNNGVGYVCVHRKNVMKVILGMPGQGKTLSLVKISSETGYYIVTFGKDRAGQIFHSARMSGYNIPFPLTYEEIFSGQYGSGVRGMLFDDLDLFMGKLLRCPIKAMTVDISDGAWNLSEGHALTQSEEEEKMLPLEKFLKLIE
jgi:hypothetical protein